MAALCAVLCTVFALCVFAAEDVVYFVATGATEGAYTDLSNLGTVSASSYSTTPTVTVPDEYEAITADGLSYFAQKINTEPAPTLVYADGVGEAENTYKDLASAALALRDDGTILVTGKVSVDSSATLLSSGDLLVTSVYETRIIPKNKP